MNRLAEVLENLAPLLDEHGVRWALIGGLAVSAHCEPRFTRDVDLAVAVKDDSAAEALIHFLQTRGYTIFELVEQEALDRLATARLVPPGETEYGVVVDLLFASSGIEREVAADAQTVELVTTVFVPVAQLGHLVALKLLSRGPTRPQDELDLQHLIAACDAEQLELGRKSVAQIQSRGFNRERDLISIFSESTEPT